MSLAGAMYTAANGLTSHSDAMNVVSDNIANVNTTGFKAGSALFEDVIASASVSGTGSIPQGQGSDIADVEQVFTQGTLLPTGRPTDLALEGNGFFVVSGSFQGEEGSYFTRSGRFHIDHDGDLVNPEGLALQGYTANRAGILETSLNNLHIGGVSLQPPNSTTSISCSANLDAEAPVQPTFDVDNPGETSTFSTSVAIYDSRGDSHNLDLYFSDSGPSSYNWYALVDGGQVASGTPGKNFLAGSGALTFNTDGSLNAATGTSLSFDFIGATPGQSITLSVGDPTSEGGTGVQGLTSYAGASNLTQMQQDGYSQGALLGVGISGDGLITGNFTNGKSRLLGQVAVASFINNGGLSRIGGSLYSQTGASGLAIIGDAATGGRGSIASGQLEQSNVNLSQEFINLMAYQRGFEANTRSIQTCDQMMQELVNLGR
jgi:flagellar hook protein FlgE